LQLHFNFKKLGFKREGIRREHFIGADGQPDDEYSYGILKDEWLEHRVKLKSFMHDDYRFDLVET